MTVPGPDAPGPHVPGPNGPGSSVPGYDPAAQYPAPQYPGPQGPTPPAGQGGSSKKKWFGIAGGVVVAGVVGASALGLFGAGSSEVGDCIKTTSDTEYETVDCSSDEAQFKIVGIDDQEMTYKDFEDAPVEDICVDFADETEYALWEGEMVTEPGTIYCAGPV
ncbi:hypothetical protein SAMN05660485_01536 [Blastococcus fimeti]|nr:hypothetical protein SAMN05660485_01536 [Blastococcus fimeti]